MSREVTEAHYLHERSGLEPVLRPPVHHPTALAWVPGREELIVGTRDGSVQSVDPVLGTRMIAEGIGEVGLVCVHPDRKRYLVVTREGRWQVGTLRGEVLARGRHSYMGTVDAFFANDYVVMVGDEPDGRFLTILHKETVKGRARLPTRVTAVLSPSNKLLLARSTPAGLMVISFGKGCRFPKSDSTVHRLRPSNGQILGFTGTGICVWGQEGGVPRSMRLPDLTAGAISANAKYLGLGTRSGAVALARMDQLAKRVRPDLVRAFDGSVTCLAFSDRGRWLATGAEGLRIWSWED